MNKKNPSKREISKIDKLIEVISRKRKAGKILLDKRITLFFINPNKNECIRIYRGSVSAIKSVGNSHVFALTDNPLTREKVLEQFSRLEFVIDELIRLIAIGQNFEKSIFFDDIFVRMSFSKKIDVLRKHKYILKKTYTMLVNIAKTRNDLAHKWALWEVKYKSTYLENVKKAFVSDFNKCIDETLDAYLKVQQKVDLNTLINMINKSS